MPGAARILGLTLNRPATLLLAVCSDRVVRLFEVAKQRQPPAALHSADAVRRALAISGVRTLYHSQNSCTLLLLGWLPYSRDVRSA